MGEKVLVVKSLGKYYNGLVEQIIDLDTTDYEFRDRDEVENDPSFQQVIPYVMIMPAGTPLSIVTYRRGKGGGESRLHDLWSIGFGGHITPEDVGESKCLMDVLENAFYRELKEELSIESKDLLSYLTIYEQISSDQTDVDKVHLGVIIIATVHKDMLDTKIAESGVIEDVKIQRVDEINLDELETWSKIAIETLREAEQPNE